MYYFTYDPWIGKLLYLEDFYVMKEYRGMCLCVYYKTVGNHRNPLTSFILSIGFGIGSEILKTLSDVSWNFAWQTLYHTYIINNMCGWWHNINDLINTSRQLWRIDAAACTSSWLSQTRHPSTFTSAAVLLTSRWRRVGDFSGLIRRVSWKCPLKSEMAWRSGVANGTWDSSRSLRHWNLWIT